MCVCVCIYESVHAGNIWDDKYNYPGSLAGCAQASRGEGWLQPLLGPLSLPPCATIIMSVNFIKIIVRGMLQVYTTIHVNKILRIGRDNREITKLM